MEVQGVSEDIVRLMQFRGHGSEVWLQRITLTSSLVLYIFILEIHIVQPEPLKYFKSMNVPGYNEEHYFQVMSRLFIPYNLTVQDSSARTTSSVREKVTVTSFIVKGSILVFNNIVLHCFRIVTKHIK